MSNLQKNCCFIKEDLTIINENIVYLAQHSPDLAHKAQLVLSEIGAQVSSKLKAEEVNSLSELILFHKECTLRDASLEEIRNWKEDMSLGIKPSFLASLLDKKKTPSIGMDI